MDKTTLLKYTTLALVLLNVGSLSYFFLSQPKHHKPTPREIIIKKLDFNSEQIQKYDALIEEHHNEIEQLNQHILKAKKTLYGQLSRSENSVTTDSLYVIIADYQQQIERAHFIHFLDIKKMCTPDQAPHFLALTEELTQIFNKKHPKHN